MEGQKIKEEVELVTLKDEDFDKMTELRGTVFKEFIKMGKQSEDTDLDESDIMGLFMRKELETINIYVDDPYESLGLADIAKLLSRTMEINNMEELFRAFDRLNRGTPATDLVE